MTDVAPGASLLDWVTGLVSDPTAQARFAADPHGVLGEVGLADLDPADLNHALPLVTDTVAARFDAVVDGSASIPGSSDGGSTWDAAIRQLTALPDRIVPLDASDHVDHHDTVHDLRDHVDGHAVVDLDGLDTPHDVPAGFDDAHHDAGDPADLHDLDDRAHDAWSAGPHRADAAADHARPDPAFATGHASHLGLVRAEHTGTEHTGTEHTGTDWHDDGLVHGSADFGDHDLDEAGAHRAVHADEHDHLDHPDHSDSHHDPGAALGAS